MSYNKDDDTSALGVTISMIANETDFMGNIWCQPITGVDTCNAAHTADCRFSASLYNHEMMLQYDPMTKKAAQSVSWAMNRPIGVVFNQHMVEGPVGKCAYTFDGATSNKWNGGCGAGGSTCWNGGYAGTCAFGELCTGQSEIVVSAMCKTHSQPQGMALGLQTDQSGPQCFYELPGLAYPKTSAPNHLREMVNARVKFQAAGVDPITKVPLVTLWNEVVLDDRALIPAIREDPASAIWAFVYDDSSPNFEQSAITLRDNFCDTFKCKTKPPLVAFTRWSFASNNGPFHAGRADHEQAEICLNP